MKLKKTLALLLAVAMMICALGMTAYATEDADATAYWSGAADTSWFNEPDENGAFIIDSAEDLAGLAKLVDEYAIYDDEEECYLAFENVTIKLGADIDLSTYGNGEPVSFNPIGSYSFEKAFAGTFDGQGHTISNMYQNGWALGNGLWDGDDCGLGLFGLLYNAKVENLKIDNADLPTECNLIGFVAGAAFGNCTFKDITITNSYSGNHSYYSGGIVGWAAGNHSYINCDLDETNVISSQWGDFNNALGGIIGGTGKNGTYHIEDCDVACVLDAFNDITSAYEWHSYRNCGMLVGDTGKTVEKDGTVYADASHITAVNNNVIYGKWANYTYCQFNAMSYPWVRVEAGESTSAYGNARYDKAYDANGDPVVDENHVHNDGEGHNVMIPLCQLFGGPVSGDGRSCIYGEATKEGVEITDNAKAARTVAEVWAPQAVARSTGYVLVDSYETLKDALAAAEEGYVVKLVKDIELSETMTVSENITLDLNGCTITGKDNAQSGSFVLFKVSKDAAFTVDDSVGSGVITLEAVNNRGWGGASSIISNEGGTLIIEGGRLEHLGGSDMAYAIDNNSTLGETTLTVNDGTIISPYRAIRAFQNSRTEMNTININGGEISARAGIWMQQPGASASFGTLNIAGGEFDCYSNAVVTDICGAGDTVVNISGGEFKNENANANLLLVWPLTDLASAQNAKAKLNITGGTFECAGEGKLFGFLDENDDTLGNAADMVDVSGGAFNQTFDETYLAEDYIISVDEYGYYTPVADNSGSNTGVSTPIATKVKAALVPVNGNPNKYDIVLTANENAEIHRFLSAELNIKFVDETPLSIKNIVGNTEYGVEVINPKYNESGVWGFHLDDKAIEATDASLTIATIELMGYGQGQLILAPHDNNKVEAVESVEGNIVKEYLPTNTEDAILEIDRTVHDVELLVPTKDLRIEITFPNPIEDSVAAYQDMTVTVDGADIDAIVTELGSDNGYLINEKQYVIVIEDALTENNSYNITVEGAGYRTADYRVTMTEDKTVYFWNNLIKGDPIAFEEGGTVKANASFLAGDIAEDNIIDKYDLAAVVSYFGKYNLKGDEATYKYAKYDLNRDGKIDSEDIAYVLVSFGY